MLVLYISKESVAALNQLSKMREQLDKKQEDLGLTDEEEAKKQQKSRNNVWDGLAEI